MVPPGKGHRTGVRVNLRSGRLTGGGKRGRLRPKSASGRGIERRGTRFRAGSGGGAEAETGVAEAETVVTEAETVAAEAETGEETSLKIMDKMLMCCPVY